MSPAMLDTFQYKFINGGVVGSWEPVPSACAVNQNREVIISGNTTIPVVCFSKCDPCLNNVDTVKVTLRVDMTNETTGDTVSVAGDFQLAAGFSGDWTPGTTVLTDANMD